MNTSDQASGEVNDAPTGTVASVITSFWQSNLIGFRVERMINYQAVSGAVAYAVAPLSADFTGDVRRIVEKSATQPLHLTEQDFETPGAFSAEFEAHGRDALRLAQLAVVHRGIETPPAVSPAVEALRAFVARHRVDQRRAAVAVERQRLERQLYENVEKMLADLDEATVAAALEWMQARNAETVARFEAALAARDR